MAIYRGSGGAGEANDDATLSDITQQANNAASSATAAASSATAAASSATDAETAQAAAEAAQALAEAAQEAIDGTYLGALSSDPTVDGNGDPVTVGDWYFNTTDNSPKIYDGSAWDSINPSLVNDSTPELGGDLDANGHDITFGDNDKAIFGAGSDLQIYHDGVSDNYITSHGSSLTIFGTGYFGIGTGTIQSPTVLVDSYLPAGAGTYGVKLYYSYYGTESERLATTPDGISVTGDIVVSGTVDGVDIQTLNTTAGSALQNIVEDTTPQLGGTLDLNSNNIVGLGQISISGNTTSQDELVTRLEFKDQAATSNGDYGKVRLDVVGRPGSVFTTNFPDLYIRQYVSGTTDGMRDRMQFDGDTGYIRLFDADGNATFTYDNTGRIETTQQVTTHSGFYSDQEGDNTTNVGYLTAVNNEVYVGNITGGYPISFRVGNLEKARLTSDGYLGIGTSTPASELDVNGTVTVNGHGIGRFLAKTTNTSFTPNQYFKIARITLDTRFDEYTVTGSLFTSPDGQTELNHEVFEFSVYQVNEFGNDPWIHLHQFKNGQTRNDLGYVIVQNTPSTIVDLYVKVTYSSTRTNFWTNAEGFPEFATWLSEETGSTTQPTGWVAGDKYSNWNTSNDGSGSGLDADLLDGNEASAFVAVSGDSMTGDLSFGDNNKAIFGAGSDLQIYHDGSGTGSYITENGTGVLRLRSENGDGVGLYGASNAVMLFARNGAEVDLRYNGSTKLATTSTGIDVTGTVTADGLTVDGTSNLKLTNISHTDARYTFTHSTTSESGWIGIPSWDTDAMYIYAPNGAGANEQVASYTGNALTLSTNGGVKRQFIANNGNISFYEDTGTTAKFFWDASAESLGIGTSSPETQLQVSYSDISNSWGYSTYDLISCESSTASGINLVTDTTGTSFISFSDTDARSRGTIEYHHSSSADYMSFDVAAAERMRIDSSGNLLVGKTTTSIGTAGARITPDGGGQFVVDGSECVALNRKTSDGNIALFMKDGATVGSIGTATTNADRTYFVGGNHGLGFDTSDAAVLSVGTTGVGTDGTISIGKSSSRFDDIYATNGTIQTSDEREKQDIDVLSDAEHNVAVAAKGLIRKYRWKDSVAEKGDDARIHVGIIAQDLKAAFEAEGLDAGRYAMFIHTEWWEAEEIYTDDDGVEQTLTNTFDTEAEAPEGAVKKDRMGVRYPELLAFIIAAI